MIRGFNANIIADKKLRHAPINPKLALTDGVTSAVAAMDTEGDMEVGVWEHSVGDSTDIEVEEVFIVISGKGRVTCDQGGVIELSPGTVGILPSGSRTTLSITEPLRKVWVTLA